jgi:flagellar basal body-associated protein FliL
MLLYSSLSNLLINVVGRALMLVAKTVGMDGLVAVILAVLLGILAAVVSIYFGVFQVKLYHHLQAETPR